MKKFRDHDIKKIKQSLFTEADLRWVKNQIKLLTDLICNKNKSRQKEALQLYFTIDKILSSPASLEIRTYACLSEIQYCFRIACGKNHVLWSLFYRDLCDQKIVLMEKEKQHYTFARGLATLLQRVGETIPGLFVTRISESGKKELSATLDVIDGILPSNKEILLAKNVFASL